VPALQSTQPDLASALKSGSRSGSLQGSRIRTGLLVAQAALAIVLVAGASMFIRSLRNAQEVDVGIDLDHVLVARVDQGAQPMTNGQARRMFDEFVRRAEQTPRIRGAALTLSLPFSSSWGTSLKIPGRELSTDFPNVYQYLITPKYFEVLGIRTMAGRTFSASDYGSSNGVVVVNQQLARLLWPRQNALGRCVKIEADTAPCSTVIGVVSNTHRQDLVEDTAVPQIYLPLEQPSGNAAAPFFGYTLVARTAGDATLGVNALRESIQGSGPAIPYASVQVMRDLLGRHTRNWELGAKVFSAFGILALVLAGFGLFSVVAFTVAQRTYEFGVRTALGARPRDLLRLTLIRGVSPAVAGIGVGIVIVLAGGRLLDGLLFKESARDPAVFGVAAAILLVCAVAASLIPSIRASRVDPKIALASD
jgi:putative ABC transport system permease protein